MTSWNIWHPASLVGANRIFSTLFLDFTAIQPIKRFTTKDSWLFFFVFTSGRSTAAFHSGKAMPDYEVFSILLLAPDQWKLRQQLEGFLQFGGSLACWGVTVTFDVRAPPTGRTQKRLAGAFFVIYSCSHCIPDQSNRLLFCNATQTCIL